MSAPFRFWVVNPSDLIARKWERLVKEQGWDAAALPDARAFIEELSSASIGVALIDWNCLEGEKPRSLAAMKAKANGVSFIITSGAGLADDQVIELLEAGADDYFLYSLHPDLMIAKLKAHLRRLLPSIAQTLDVIKSPGGDIKLDRSRHEVSLRANGRKWIANTDFTATEIQLLALFLERPGAALPRRFIIDALWEGDTERIHPGTVDKHVESLRKKLGRLGSRIRTIYGVGYAYREG